MAIRTTLARQLFEERFFLKDRKGAQLSSGGDVELCYKARLKGYKIGYDAGLKLKHFIPQNRVTLSYIKKLYAAKAQSAVVLGCYKMIFREGRTFDKSGIWIRLLKKNIKKYLQTFQPDSSKNGVQRQISRSKYRGQILAIIKLNRKIDRILRDLSAMENVNHPV